MKVTKWIWLLGIGYVPMSMAQSELQTVVVQANEDPSEVVEESTTLESASGKEVIDDKILKELPTTNSNINEAIRILPEVQLDDSARTSTQAGEIKPGKISIQGGLFYQNNFILDGAPNNSLLDPASDSVGNAGEVGGAPQEMFLDLDVVESITVYSSNVPAKYGQFSGGVVDAVTKRPSFEASGKISGSYTSDKFTQFHVNERQDEEFSERAADFQPQFEKMGVNLLVETPVNDSNAVLFSYNVKNSTIPVLHLGEAISEKRKLENFMGKWTHYASDQHIIDVSLTYAPYEEDRLLNLVKDSQYKVKGGGYKASLESEDHFSFGMFKTTLSYNQSENSREAKQNLNEWAPSKNFPWWEYYGGRTAKEGGYGDLKSTQERIYVSSVFDSKSFDLFGMRHGLNIGVELNQVSAEKKRSKAATEFYPSLDETTGNASVPASGIANLVCNGADACVDGDQYSDYKQVYLPETRNADILNSSLFLEDNFDYQRLSGRLGVRYDYNDFMQNHDLAYRSFAKFDVLGNKALSLTGGMNRYYANTFLTYKLRQSGNTYQQYSRNSIGGYDQDGQKIITLDDWQANSGDNRYVTRYSNLNTPYTDEKSIGLEAEVFSGQFVVEKVYRNGYNQFTAIKTPVQDDGKIYHEMTNDGWSEYESWKVAWTRSWPNHYVTLSYYKGEGVQNYLDNYDDETDKPSTQIVQYGGKEIDLASLGKINNVSPGTAKIYYAYTPIDGLQLGIYGQYIEAHQKLEKVGQALELGRSEDIDKVTPVDIYGTQNYAEYFQADVSVSYRQKLWSNYLVASVNINNVTNNVRTITNATTSTFVLGRQYLFNLSYEW